MDLVPACNKSLKDRLLEALRDISSFEHLRYHLAEWIAWLIYPKYKFSEFGRIYLEDVTFEQYYRRFCGARNVHSYDRKYLLRELLKLAIQLPGDLIEFGVYRGASLVLMCEAIKTQEKLVIGVDSFKGLSKPTKEDSDFWREGDLRADLSMVYEAARNNPRCVLVSGWLPECLSQVPSNQFCFGHIDVDLYEPTKAALEFLYPHTVDRGIILLDDYGLRACPGAKLAIDELMADFNEPVILLPTGQGLIIRNVGNNAPLARADS